MKFCFKCGNQLSGNEKFCPRCGQKLPVAAGSQPEQQPVMQPSQPVAPARPAPAPQQPEPQPAPQQPAFCAEKARKCSRHGIIFTDLDVLSAMVGSDRDTLYKLLDQYTDLMADADIDYRIVDVSDYKFVSKAAGRKGQKASFDEDSPWWDYQHVLYDIMCYEKERSLPESNYLFIIGGHEVIPVPAINHYIKNHPRLKDVDIETDLLYSYPYGPHTQYALETTEIYTQEMYYFAGRLPVPKGADASFIVNYLQNAIDNRHGLMVKKMYAQSDPHWKNLTAWLMSPYNKAGMLADRSNISGKFSHENVLLGPYITSEYINAVMETDTDMVYLNLHGSRGPGDPHYSGEYPEHTSEYATIFPVEAMLIPEHCNVFVAEACYGGRFVGYDIAHSMIQAGLSHKTIIGLASSRVAFGDFDPPGGNADKMCGMFTYYLLTGNYAGEALVRARSDFFAENGMVDPYDAATLAEFNLFGDPSLRAVAVVSEGAKMPKLSKAVAPKGFVCGYEEDNLKSADNKPQSLLEQVRGAVDANIKAISQTIGQELYAKYGLSPREPETVRRIRFRNGKQRLIHTYANGESTWVVRSTPEGKIESVMTSK